MGPEKPTNRETSLEAATTASSSASVSSPIVSTGAVLDAPFNGALQPVDPKAINQGSLLDQASSGMADVDVPLAKRSVSRQRMFGLGLLLFGCLATVMLGIRIEANRTKAQEVSLASPSARFQQQQVSIGTLDKQLGNASAVTGGNTVTVNGSLVLTPTVQPSSPVPGQLFFNQAVNQVQYYDGTGIVHLQGSVTNNTYNNSTVSNSYANSTVNNTYNTTSVTNNIGATFSGTPGTLAMFGAGGSTLANSLVNQSGSTVNVATSGTNTVNVGSGTGASTTGIQGGTGGASLLTGAANGASGTITIQSGDSSTTSSGNVSVDTGVNSVTGTVVEDKTYESSTEGTGDAFGFVDTYASSMVQAHSGTHSLAVTSGNGQYGGGTDPSWFAGDPVPFQTPAVAGDNYVFSAWIRAQTNARTVQCDAFWSSTGYGGGGEVEDDQWCTVTDSNSQWKHVSGTVTAPPGAHSLGVDFTGYGTPAGEVTYIDDVVVTDVSSSTTSSQLNLGANNAQQITIGNTSQTSATTIYGHGITLNGGQSADTITGGSIGLSSKSTITLTGGSSASSGVTVNAQGLTTSLFSVQGGGVNLLNVDSTDKQVSLGVGSGTSVGLSGIGTASNGGSGIDEMSAQKFTTGAGGGTIASMSAYIDSGGTAPYNEYQFAIYADNSGTPGAFVASSGIGILGASAAWYSLPITAVLTPNTTFWMVYWEHDNANDAKNGWSYDFPVAGTQNVSTTFPWQSGSDNGMPATFPTAMSGGAVQASLYATYASPGPALTIDRYGSLTQSGSAAFQDLTNSTNALQVKNADGSATLFNIDTAGNNASLGVEVGAGTTDLQGGTGGVSITTGLATGVSGGVAIQSGNSSTTSAGNISLDTGSSIINGTTVSNNTFETNTEGYGAHNGGVAQTTAVAHGGNGSLAFTQGVGGTWDIYQQNQFNITPGHTYNVTAWVRGGANPETISSAMVWAGLGTFRSLADVTESGSSWTEISGTVTAPVGATAAYMDFGGTWENAGFVHYLDDVTVIDMSSSSTQALVSIGGTNAQAVTLGNANEIGATNIYGGSGINLNSGVGNITLTSGSTTVKASGNSSSTFLIQDTSNAALFTADTTNMNITIGGSLVATGNITVNGHIITGGSTPQIAAGAAACTTPTVGVIGTDTTGTVTITTGSGCSGGGTLATITFANSFANGPNVILTPSNAAASALQYYNGTSIGADFTIDTNNAPANTSTYKWHYWVAQ